MQVADRLRLRVCRLRLRRARLSIRLLIYAVAVFLAPLFSAPTVVMAQQQLATMQGTITDETGAVIPGVTVTATSIDTGVSRVAITNDAGVYRLPSLEPGRYRVSAELTGFSRAIRDTVTLEVGATVGLPFVMRAGSVTEDVVVKGEAAAVQTERADISSVVERKRIEDLPLVSRNPLALTALQPGVTGIPTRNDLLQPEQELGISASGMRGGANSAYIDGMRFCVSSGTYARQGDRYGGRLRRPGALRSRTRPRGPRRASQTGDQSGVRNPLRRRARAGPATREPLADQLQTHRADVNGPQYERAAARRGLSPVQHNQSEQSQRQSLQQPLRPSHVSQTEP